MARAQTQGTVLADSPLRIGVVKQDLTCNSNTAQGARTGYVATSHDAHQVLKRGITPRRQHSTSTRCLNTTLFGTASVIYLPTAAVSSAIGEWHAYQSIAFGTVTVRRVPGKLHWSSAIAITKLQGDRLPVHNLRLVHTASVWPAVSPNHGSALVQPTGPRPPIAALESAASSVLVLPASFVWPLVLNTGIRSATMSSASHKSRSDSMQHPHVGLLDISVVVHICIDCGHAESVLAQYAGNNHPVKRLKSHLSFDRNSDHTQLVARRHPDVIGKMHEQQAHQRAGDGVTQRAAAVVYKSPLPPSTRTEVESAQCNLQTLPVEAPLHPVSLNPISSIGGRSAQQARGFLSRCVRLLILSSRSTFADSFLLLLAMAPVPSNESSLSSHRTWERASSPEGAQAQEGGGDEVASEEGQSGVRKEVQEFGAPGIATEECQERVRQHRASSKPPTLPCGDGRSCGALPLHKPPSLEPIGSGPHAAQQEAADAVELVPLTMLDGAYPTSQQQEGSETVVAVAAVPTVLKGACPTGDRVLGSKSVFAILPTRLLHRPGSSSMSGDGALWSKASADAVVQEGAMKATSVQEGDFGIDRREMPSGRGNQEHFGLSITLRLGSIFSHTTTNSGAHANVVWSGPLRNYERQRHAPHDSALRRARQFCLITETTGRRIRQR
ncbi:unnamed protein product [Tilletia controversa]|nr:unnamed protein product [Tilletia controversa]